MTDSCDWDGVDAYIGERLLGSDPVLDAALAGNAAAGLPAIDVSPPQGRMLQLLARIAGARRILEIGTLGGYSTIELARALPDRGQLITLELDPKHAAVARDNVARAGLADRVEFRVGPALGSLAPMQDGGEAPFDLIFIDADKPNNANYVKAALTLSRQGTTIIVDNVVREGSLIEANSSDPVTIGNRELFDYVASEPRLSATAVQTVGAKQWDGFLLAIVD